MTLCVYQLIEVVREIGVGFVIVGLQGEGSRCSGTHAGILYVLVGGIPDTIPCRQCSGTVTFCRSGKETVISFFKKKIFIHIV
jgi:hypothetical protein